jgi:adhesin transport system outer membrane protein
VIQTRSKAVACAVGVVALFATTHSFAMPLEDAVQTALRTHPSVLAAQEVKRAAGFGVDIATAGFRPTIDLRVANGVARTNNSTTRGRDGRDPEDPQSVFLYRFESSITLSQMLFDGFGTANRRNSAQARQQGASFQVMGVEEGVALRAVTAYLQVLQGRQLLALGEDYIRSHETVLLGLKAQVEGGAGAQADLDQAEGRLALAQAAVTQFRGGLADAEAAFREAVGGRPTDLVAPMQRDSLLPATADAAVAEALATHPGVKALAENVRSQEFDLRAASSTSYPRISLDLMGTRSENAGGVKGVTGDATAMITLTYNLYRGGADKAQLEAARALLNEARLRQEESGRLLEQGVRVAFTALEISKTRMPQLEDALKSAEEGRAAFDDRFEAGDVKLLDLLGLEDQLFQAAGGVISGRSAVMLSYYQVLGAMGRLRSSL